MKKEIQTAYGSVELEVRELGDSRIFVTHEGFTFPAGTKSRGLVLKKDLTVPAGAVLVPAWYDFGGRNQERLHRIFPGGIYEAMRGRSHALHRYGVKNKPGELQTLRDIGSRINHALAILARGKAVSLRERKKVQLDLAAIARRLGRPISKLKWQATRQIAAAATLEVQHPSGTRSINVPATIQRLRAAENRLKTRQNNVRRIAPRVSFFEQTLAMAIGEMFDDLRLLREILQKERAAIARGFSLKVWRIFSERVCFMREVLSHLDAAPFLKTTKMIKRDLGIALAAKHKSIALAAIDRILTAIRLKEAQGSLEMLVITLLALNENLGLMTEEDMDHVLMRLLNFARRFKAEIDDTGFVRPVKERVLSACRGVIVEAFNPVVPPDVSHIKEQLKAISSLL